MSTPFPARLDDLDPARLTAAIRVLHPDVTVRAFELRSHHTAGDGHASTADRLHLSLDHDAPHLPRDVVLKTIGLHPWFRFGPAAIRALGATVHTVRRVPGLGAHGGALVFALVNLYQRFFPHAPQAMYENEVRFYREVADELGFDRPTVLGADFDPTDGQFGVLMEDLTARGATFPTAEGTLPEATLRHLLDGLAALHAAFWDHPRLDDDLAWLPTTRRGGMHEVFDRIGRELVRDQVRANPFKQELLRPLGASVDDLWDALWRAQDQLAHGPTTLLHGDAHVGNTFVLPDGAGGFFDFQLAMRGSWAHDVTYLLVSSQDPATRRRLERSQLAYYLDRLAAHGVADVPDPDEAWERHRRTAIWGLVIGWLTCPPQNYGVPITAANVERTAVAMADLGTLDLIG